MDYLSKDGVINEATVNGKTAVWYAAMDGNLEIIQLLCRRSSQVFKKDNELTTDPSKINMDGMYLIIVQNLVKQIVLKLY